MILRTFHFAGIAATITTSGLPRIVELLDAKKKPTTPFSSIYLNDEHQEGLLQGRGGREEDKRGQDERHSARGYVENFSKGKIKIVLDKQLLDAVDLTPKQVAARISKAYELDASADDEGNMRVSTHTKNLKEIRVHHCQADARPGERRRGRGQGDSDAGQEPPASST